MPLRVGRLLPVVPALALTVVVASCGSPDEEAGPATRTSPTTSQFPTEPSSASGPRRDAPRTTVTFVGDIMLGRGVAAAHPDDPVAPLRPMRPLLHGSDLTVGNLESTLSDDGAPRQGDDSFAAVPQVVPAMGRLGVDALSLANNHTGDFGPAALLATVAAFRDTGVSAFGAGRDLRAAARPVVLERHGIRFGFLGFNAIGETPRATPGDPGALSVRMPPRTGPLDKTDLARVLGAVRRLDRRVDVVVVMPHWGTQYTHRVGPAQRFVGRRLVDAGADLVVGGHPHWVQGTERYRGATIAYSLGNFVFDMDFMQETTEGVALTATFRGDRLRRVELTPYRLDDRFAPRLVHGAAARRIVAQAR
jgi:poly-gamma-glutamate capsule biosynthesis protein CapA/YwtB (metallophosphatase superfamily)